MDLVNSLSARAQRLKHDDSRSPIPSRLPVNLLSHPPFALDAPCNLSFFGWFVDDKQIKLLLIRNNARNVFFCSTKQQRRCLIVSTRLPFPLFFPGAYWRRQKSRGLTVSTCLPCPFFFSLQGLVGGTEDLLADDQEGEGTAAAGVDLLL